MVGMNIPLCKVCGRWVCVLLEKELIACNFVYISHHDLPDLYFVLQLHKFSVTCACGIDILSET